MRCSRSNAANTSFQAIVAPGCLEVLVSKLCTTPLGSFEILLSGSDTVTSVKSFSPKIRPQLGQFGLVWKWLYVQSIFVFVLIIILNVYREIFVRWDTMSTNVQS